MSLSQATIQTKSKARSERGPAWHRSTTRKVILDTAREMIEQDGLEKTSLLRISEIAGFAPTTVYAYFVRKADLISAIVADDLSSFARTIKDGFPFSEVPEPEAQEDEPHSAEAVHAEIMEHCASAIDEATECAEYEDLEEDDGATDSFDPLDDEDTSAERAYVEPRSDREAAPVADHEMGALSAMEARIAQLEARRADPWLERRLREFERMLATLDERVGAASQADAGTVASSDPRIQEVLDRLEAFEKKHVAAAEEHMKTLTDNFDARETRLRQAQTELRTMTLESTGRLEVLERDRELRALAVEMPAVEFAPRKQQPAPEEIHVEESAAEAAPEASANAEESYLAAARRAALTAQSLAQTEEKRFSDEVSSWAAPVKARTRLLVSVCAGLGVVLLVAEFLLNHRATAAAPPVHAPPTVHVAKLLLPPDTAPHGADFSSVNSAALAGNSRAQLQMGLVYLNGNGVTEDDTRAGHWLEAAAMQGQPVAQYWLATLFEHGKGESADPAEAIRWYEASALQGNLKAMYKLAVSYAEGWGTHQNYGESARWFSRAAELGFVNAQFNLGVLYERGFGVPQSLLDSYKWYALAAAQGDKDSAARVEALSTQLSPEDLSTARDAVAGFKPQLLNTEANEAPALPAIKPPLTQASAQPPKN